MRFDSLFPLALPVCFHLSPSLALPLSVDKSATTPSVCVVWSGGSGSSRVYECGQHVTPPACSFDPAWRSLGRSPNHTQLPGRFEASSSAFQHLVTQAAGRLLVVFDVGANATIVRLSY